MDDNAVRKIVDSLENLRFLGEQTRSQEVGVIERHGAVLRHELKVLTGSVENVTERIERALTQAAYTVSSALMAPEHHLLLLAAVARAVETGDELKVRRAMKRLDYCWRSWRDIKPNTVQREGREFFGTTFPMQVERAASRADDWETFESWWDNFVEKKQPWQEEDDE